MKRFFSFALVVLALAAATGRAAEKGMIGLTGKGGVGIPTGTLDDATKVGWRAGGGVEYFITNNIAIGANGFYAQNKADDTLIVAPVTDIKEQLIEYGVFGKYAFKIQDSRLAPYVKLGVGGLSAKTKITPEPAGGNQTETFFGGNAGAGLSFDVAPKVSVFVEGAYHDYAKSDFRPINYFAGNGGVIIWVGKGATE